MRAELHGETLRFESMGLHDEGPFKRVFQVTGQPTALQEKSDAKRRNVFFDIAYSPVLS